MVVSPNYIDIIWVYEFVFDLDNNQPLSDNYLIICFFFFFENLKTK